MQAAGENISLNRPSEVIYQIYPSSFCDTNNDGVGDLKGITRKLDYIADLGVDAIWLNPFYDSPEGKEGDGGYAVRDYRKVAEKFGTKEDFKELLEKAHEKGLRVYVDFVPCHTSKEHEWFEKSRRREEGFEDFYVWHPGKTDERGNRQPPNNWKSVFDGGWKTAWEWDDTRQEYFLHHFSPHQPSLNLNSDKVQKAILNEMKFWLGDGSPEGFAYGDGVDGFRLDALPYAHHYVAPNLDPKHPEALPSNPSAWGGDSSTWGSQYFAYSMCQPETILFAAKVRAMMEKYGQETGKKKTALGETIAGPKGGQEEMEHAVKYLDPDVGLDSCYTQSFVQFWKRYPDAGGLREMIKKSVRLSPDGGLGDALGNHDFIRYATRMTMNEDGSPAINPAFHGQVVKQILSLWASMPGSKYLYNGDELGLTEALFHEIPKEVRDQDPDPAQPRSGCRTAFPHTADEPEEGSALQPVRSHRKLAVDMQQSQADSTLNVTKRLLKQRNASLALTRGKTTVLEAGNESDNSVVAFVRETNDEAIFCAFNMSEQEVTFKISDYLRDAKDAERIHNKLEAQGINVDEAITMRPYDAAHYGLKTEQGTKMEVGMSPAAGPILESDASPTDNEGKKKIFALDLLIADIFVKDPECKLQKHLRNNGVDTDSSDTVKGMLTDEQRGKLYRDYRKLKLEESEPITGGSTSCTLGTLAKLCKNAKVKLMGFAASDPQGAAIRRFHRECGVTLDARASGSGTRTATSYIVQSGDKTSVLTWPGTEIDAFHHAMHHDLDAKLEDEVRNTDILYLPESSLSRFGLPYVWRMLNLRWVHKKEMVLTLPSSAELGPDDPNHFRQWIPSCNIVLGNDAEFARIYHYSGEMGPDGNTRPALQRPPTDAPVAAINEYKRNMYAMAQEIRKAFNQRVLENEGMPVSEHGPAALITCGPHATFLVTREQISEIPVKPDPQKVSPLGARNAAFAGFMAGYVQGWSHQKSAEFAMAVAADKIREEGNEPYPYLRQVPPDLQMLVEANAHAAPQPQMMDAMGVALNNENRKQGPARM